eukprot:PITA_02492
MATTSYFKFEDTLKDKFDYHAWKMALDFTLEEHDAMDYVKGRVVEPPSNAPVAAKTKYKKGEVKVKKVIIDSIQKHLVAYIFDLETSKEMYDKLVGMFKVNDANQILFLKNKLKDIKMDKRESIQSYFMRITQIKNDLLSIVEVIADKELTLIALGERQGQGFKTGFKEGRKRRCYNCNRFGHYARECSHKKDTPRDDENNNNNNKGNGNQRNNRFNNKGKRNATDARYGNDRPPKRKRNSRYEESNVVEKQKEFYLISALSIASPPETLDHWLIDSGASRHFTGYKEALSNLVEKKTNLEIILGDNATYPMKGAATITLHLNQGQTIHPQEVLYVPDLKKNLVSISAMEDKGLKVAFIDGKVRIWQRNPKNVFTLGFRVEGLY